MPIAAADPPDGIVIDTTGADHLHGGEAAMLIDMVTVLPRLASPRPSVELMWGVSHVTKAKLSERGILTIGQLANTPGRAIDACSARPWAKSFRRWPGTAIRAGSEPNIMRARQERSLRLAPSGASKGCSSLPSHDRVAFRLRAKSLAGSTVTVRVRIADMRAITRSMTLGAPISATVMLAENCRGIGASSACRSSAGADDTLLAISISELRKQPDTQLDLPLELPDEKRRPGAKRGLLAGPPTAHRHNLRPLWP
ncbi:MAG: hypothetical protein EOS23_26340 [Mesorhizobium sp.]|nr:MAG: hypothetical protein EOS23_26340 [Mesorhizobium sp.]